MILILSYRRKSWVHHSTLDLVQNLIYFSGPKNDQKMIHYWWIQKKWKIVDPSGPLNYMSTKLTVRSEKWKLKHLIVLSLLNELVWMGLFLSKFVLVIWDLLFHKGHESFILRKKVSIWTNCSSIQKFLLQNESLFLNNYKNDHSSKRNYTLSMCLA